YNIAANTWSAVADAPEARDAHTATWSGTSMYVWGGYKDYSYQCTNLPNVISATGDRGMRYNPSSDTWNYLSTSGQPCGIVGHSAVWNGANLIVCGGRCFDG